VNKVTDLAATSIQGLARIMQARKTKKALEKRRLEEALPPDAQFVWWTGPLLALFLLANPVLLVGIVITLLSMAVGGGVRCSRGAWLRRRGRLAGTDARDGQVVLDMQRRNDAAQKRHRQLEEMRRARRREA
jgi:hypothetical protein